MSRSYNPFAAYLIATLLILLMVLGGINQARANYDVAVSQKGVVVSISGDLGQAVPSVAANNTASPFDTLPTFSFQLVGSNSSAFSQPLEAALRARSPAASVSNMVFAASSNGTLYHYTTVFNMQGISTSHGDFESIDLAWRAFVIDKDINIGGYSLNAVVPTYLENRISIYANLPSSQGPPLPLTRTWFWNGQVIQRTAVVSTIKKLLMFNFTSLSQPLNQWTASRDQANLSVRYRTTAGANLTLLERVTEVEETGTFARDFVYKVLATVEVPWNTAVFSDRVSVQVSNALAPWIMVAIIVAGAVVFAVTAIAEGRIQVLRKTKGRLNK